ncbi:MAG TPA: bacteriohemerythrin [Geopsychrobacteraceae bacterium]|nr:bacteriohemerythrin [Geopsychrobacteraceae bacterium]
MKSFYWDKHFETGLSKVDKQHGRLVDIINQFGKMITENSLDSENIEEVFAELADYARYHFEEEEAMMTKVGVDLHFYNEHISRHRNFLQEVADMHAEIAPDKPEGGRQLLDFLTQWLVYHILGTDQSMARQIKAIQSGGDSSEAYAAEKDEGDSATKALLTALNNLFQIVSARNNELVQLNLSLEEKVSERTNALSEANQHLEELALTDVLTGLPNRRHAMRCLADHWDESILKNSPLVCTMIDADNFKKVNDTHGHDAGDTVLCQLSKTLKHGFRSDDIVCRLGGDEFLIICPRTDQQGGIQIAERTRKMVSKLRVPAGDSGENAWQGSVSVGVAARTDDMKSFEDLIKAADKAVYTAKQDGRNCVRTVV